MQLKDNKEMIFPERLCLRLKGHGRVAGCYVCFRVYKK